MSEYVGQDPDEVDRLATELGGAGSALQTLAQEVSTLVASTTWSGPDRERFETDWRGPGTGLIVRAAEALDDASRSASAGAQRQRVASGVA